MGWFNRRGGKALAVAVAVLWIATLAFAETAVTPAMHCQRGHMPCCPQSSNGESCTSARCTEQAPEKAEAQVVQADQEKGQAVVPPAEPEGARRFSPGPVRELTAGLHFRSAVFRLKDDLRI